MKNLTPEREHVRLDGAARGTIIVEAGDAPIDLEGGDVEQPPLQCVHHRLPKRLPTRRTGHHVSSWGGERTDRCGGWMSGTGSGGGHGGER